MGPEGMTMRLLLGALVGTSACSATDPTVPASTATPPPPTNQVAIDTETPDRSKEEVIELHPSVKDSSMHADVGDRVLVQVDVSGPSASPPEIASATTPAVSRVETLRRTQLEVHLGSGKHQCPDLKVKDPFGNVVAELTAKEILGGGVKFQGAFFAAVAGEYVVELGHESRNLDCAVGGSADSAEVKWEVQPR